MPSVRIKREYNSSIYFLTITVKNWYYVLDRYNRWDILANSLKFFQEKKNLKIFSYVFMINHIHLLVFSNDVSGFARDFKKFTSREILANIQKTEPSILKLFSSEEGNQFWSKTNMPELIDSDKFFAQKSNYIHNNPVKRNYVEIAENWHWSSANPNSEIKVESVYE